jgi:hypothetical protein
MAIIYLTTHLVMAGCIVTLYLCVKSDKSIKNKKDSLLDRLYTRGLKLSKRITVACCRMAASILISYIKRYYN